MMQIIDLQYFGCVNYYYTLFNNTNIKINEYENYQKMSFRNRCTIVGANGLINLSIPIEGGRNKKQLYKDVRIAESTPWAQQHWRAIVTCYAKAPFFEYYKSDLENLLKSSPKFLLDFNFEILRWSEKVLRFPHSISSIKSKNDIMAELCFSFYNKWMPNNYENETLVKPYFQVFEDRIGFKNNLSILDLIFCEGPNSNSLLGSK